MRKFKVLRSYSVRARLAAGLFVLGVLSVGLTAQSSWWPWAASADTIHVALGDSAVKDSLLQKNQNVNQSISGTQKPTTGTNTSTKQTDPVKNTTSGTNPSTGAESSLKKNTVADGESASGAVCSGFGQFDLIKSDCTLSENIANIYRKAIPLSFLMAFLVLVYAGYMYITSLGSPDKVKLAAELLVSVVTGIALLLLIPLIIQALGLSKSSTSNVPGVSNTSTSAQTGAEGATATGTGSVQRTPTNREIDEERIDANPNNQRAGGVSPEPVPSSQGQGNRTDTVNTD